MIRAAKNGCSSEIIYHGKKIYLYIDCELYENGWYLPYGDGYKNKHLFYYLVQMGNYGSHRPEALDYLSKD